MVVMDREDYTDKTQLLLADTNTYKPSQRTLPTKLKNKLSQTLRDIKKQGGLNGHIYRKMYPTSKVAPKFYGLPKNHKTGTPSSPLSPGGVHHIWGGCGAGQHHLCLAGQSPHHLKKHPFIQHIKEVKLEPGEVMTCYDVKTLLTSVPVDPSINILKQILQQDPLLSQRTNMSMPQIITLLEFYLKNTYFLFQGKYYEQVQGAAKGSTISPLIANLFMEEFKVSPLALPRIPIYGKGMWMTSLSSKRQNSVNNFYNTSTHKIHICS